MSAFDPTPTTGPAYHLRPSTPEEFATHLRLISKAEALKQEAIRRGLVAAPKFAPQEPASRAA